MLLYVYQYSRRIYAAELSLVIEVTEFKNGVKFGGSVSVNVGNYFRVCVGAF